MLNIVFAGTPEFAAIHLNAVLAAGHRVTAVYTQPDRRAGRGRKPMAGAVKALALEQGLEIRQPVTLRNQEVQAELGALKPDLMLEADRLQAFGLQLKWFSGSVQGAYLHPFGAWDYVVEAG